MGALPCYDKKKQDSVIEPTKRASAISQQTEKQPQQQQRLSHSSVEVEQHKNPQEDCVEEADEYEEDSEENDVEYIQGDLIQEGTNVYSALNTLNGQLLAIKLFYLEEDEDLNIIQDRVEVFRKLRHKNIHEILGYDYQEQRKLWILMPYESGGSISWLLQKFSKFSPHLAAVFMKQILQGLDYLHQNKIMHKNLKTSNVLVDVDTNAKLSDISILNQYGVNQYSAPELFAGGEYTTYSDIWSAGCIFIEMLTRYNPWQFESHTVTIDQIRGKLQLGKIFQFRNMVRDSETLRILQLIFKANPNERLSAGQLLELDYFKNLQTDQMASLIQQSAVHQTKLKKSVKMNNNANSLQQSHRSSVKKSLSVQSKEVLLQILNSVKIADIDILKITDHAGHQSLSHMDLQNVLSKRQKSLFSRIIPGISQSIIANDQNPVNRLISEGIIRQQGNTKVDQPQLVQQLVGKNTVKPPLMIKRHSPHDSDNFKQIQTDRSQQVVSEILIEQNRPDEQDFRQDQDGYRSPKLVQQLLGNKASEKPPLNKKHSPHGSEKSSLQSDVIVEQTRPDGSNAFESLMRRQFESKDDNEEPVGPQELEDLMCQQYYQARKDLYQDIKLPSEVIRDIEQKQTSLHDNEYFEKLMNQQFESSLSKASSLQQPINADDLEELMCQQYYQARKQINNVNNENIVQIQKVELPKSENQQIQQQTPEKQSYPQQPQIQNVQKMDDKYFENLMNQQFDSDNDQQELEVDEIEELMCKQYYQARDQIQNQSSVPDEHKELNIRQVNFEESFLEEYEKQDRIIHTAQLNQSDDKHQSEQVKSNDHSPMNTNIIVIKQRTPIQEPIQQQELVKLIDLDKQPEEPLLDKPLPLIPLVQNEPLNDNKLIKVIQFDQLEPMLEEEEEEEEDNFIVLF